MTSSVPCPSCSQPLPGASATCPHCQLPLTGPVAVRLWEVDQQLGALRTERSDLLSRLRAGAELPDSPGGTHDSPRWTGQQLLLGAGVLLLLVASLVFLAVAWSLIGVLGQVTVMAVLTLVASAAALRIARSDLRSTAEAVAGLGAGLALVDVAAARGLDLAGLAGTDPAGYTAVSAGLLAVLWALLGQDRAPLAAFRIASVVAAAVAPAATLVALAPDSSTAVATSLYATSLAFGTLAARLAGSWVGLRSLATAVAVGYLLVGLLVAVPTVYAERVAGDGGAAAVLLAVLACTAWVWSRDRSRATLDRVLVIGGGAVLVSVALVGVVSHADHVGLTVLAASGAGLAAAASWLPGSVLRRDLDTWSLAALITGHLTALLATTAVAVEAMEVFPLLDLDFLAVSLASVAVATAVTAVAPTARARVRAVTAGASATATLAAVVVVLVEHVESSAVAATALTAVAVTTLALAAWRHGRNEEISLIGVATVGVGAAVVAALDDGSPVPLAGVLAAAGLAALAYAVLPRRGRASVAGVLSCSAATWVLALDAGVETIEAYSLPLAALAALVGVVRLQREPSASSWLTAGPALTAVLLPSALATVDDPALLRPLLVLAIGGAVVTAGVVRHWQAPLVTGTVAVVVVAFSQLAPYAVGMPRYLTLGTVGLVMLLLGARYEQRRRDARHAVTWVRALR